MYIVGGNMLALYLSLIDNEDDRDKFVIIYNEYRKRMITAANSVLHNKQDAEDVLHDTFIKIARNMKAIDDPYSDKTQSYLLKAVKNTAKDFLKKKENRNEVAAQDYVENIPDMQFLEKLRIKDRYNEVVNAIRELNDTYRDVMFFHFVSEMKIAEIADLLGRKKSTVQQQLIRGKKKLIEILETDLRELNGKQ